MGNMARWRKKISRICTRQIRLYFRVGSNFRALPKVALRSTSASEPVGLREQRPGPVRRQSNMPVRRPSGSKSWACRSGPSCSVSGSRSSAHRGPVYDQGGCQSCSAQSRFGSILAGGSNLELSPDVAANKPTQAEAAKRAPQNKIVKNDPKTGVVPGSEQVISVTERVVPPSGNPKLMR
jgi:hypothetical protein